MKKKMLFLILSIALFLIILSVALFFLLKSDDVLVPVATHTIRPWQKIEAKDYTLKRVARDDLDANVIIDESELLDHYIKGQTTVYPHSYFYEGMLESEEGLKDGAYRYLSDDEVAYELYTSEIKVNAAAISAGMNIDIYLTIKDKDVVLSDLLLSNALILAKYDREGNIIKNDSDAVASFAIRIARKDVTYLNKAQALGDLSIIVSSDAYTQKDARLNEESEIIDHLQSGDRSDA